VESAPGRGTRIDVYLPRIVNQGTRSAFTGSATPMLPAGGKETILLVEDEDDVRTLMSKLLARHGYTVHAAVNGVEALELWARHRDAVDLLVTDMVMPGGIGGRELGERLSADKPGLRVIYCSGYTDEMIGDLRLRGSANFLEKPFDVHVFLGRVRSCLDA
jgi:two-component system cell cycle sensor histidine kinase/response regulator CckA